MKEILQMSHFYSMVMCDIKLWDKTTQNYTKMLITVDTGASVTTISSDILYMLGYDTTSGVTKRITTASGVSYVKSITLNMMIGRTQLNDIQVYAHNFPEESFSQGVLGLNVLTMFDSVNLIFNKNEIEFITINESGD